ncbi:SulP family inorganic anion transporter [Streptosporangium saharense]|uniref:MFS superfamily sulfate permease-like transporter n=1 Tax=Streptosporangium saharense TaxID=1706840 RepID=A0A7W7QVK1_9ACTN|nr:SulP family inorganic anion transporter [Streptosporangium saharense]MBB4920572.1 MFS superfamily sulfate permease-like transporter [Streptosporangium saharense]
MTSEQHDLKTHDDLATAPRRGAFRTADIRSGFLVFLIALPLCLGIALASGFPPVAGVLTAIIGGVLVSLLGSAPLTIKGPAAGLIVIALGAVQELDGGDLAVGYRRALAVGVVAAVIQIVFALCRVATVGIAMSPSVVHGMLAAIGVIIISKQAHVALGVKPESKETLGLIAEIPHSVANANPRILLLGALGLLVMFGMPLIRARWARAVPAPLVVLAVTVPVALWFHVGVPHDYRFMTTTYHLGPEFLVRLPGTLLDAVAFPDFSAILTGTSLKYVVMFALIGTIESTLTVLAVDSMDPEKRSSDLNRDLLALGGGNLVSALVGGLPMISEIVRSRANIDAGATSRWSNFSHGAFLLLFVALAPGLLQTIPLAVLAAMLVYTGTRLASPREFAHAGEVGLDQLALFLTTLFVTLATDLLMGVAAGLALKIVLHLVRGVPPVAFLRPRAEAVRTGSVLNVRIPNAAVFTALLPLRRTVNGAEEGVTDVVVDVSDAALVDHTFLSGLATMSREWRATLTLRGLDDLVPVSAHPQATRRRRRA